MIRKFEKRKRVLDLGSGEDWFKPRYRTLRIPRETLEEFILEECSREVAVTNPIRAALAQVRQPIVKSMRWEPLDDAIDRG
jgi:hypothetical protein